MTRSGEATEDYGEDGRTIIGNCDTYVYLGGNDVETAQAVATRWDVPVKKILNGEGCEQDYVKVAFYYELSAKRMRRYAQSHYGLTDEQLAEQLNNAYGCWEDDSELPDNF